MTAREVDAPDLTAPYDAVVIGAGAGGGPAALRLALHGFRVLVVEQGSFLPHPPRRPGEPVGAYVSHVLGGREVPMHFVGGRTKFYGAALYRMRRSDFGRTEHEKGVSPAWPLSYDDLEPYYGQAEELFRVHGSPDGDPSEPPRSVPFPHPPIPHQDPVAGVVDRLRRSGTPVSSIPLGLDRGPGGACVLCHACDAHLCRLDAKMDAEIAAIRPALATGRVALSTGTVCERILTGPSGRRVTGVELRRGEERVVVRAPIVVAAAGIPGSAALLRRSRNDAHPEGLGNAGGALGKHLGGHSTGMLFALMGLSPVPPSFTKTFALNALHDGAEGWPYPLGVVQAAGQMPFWEEARGPMRVVARLVGRRSLMCFYMTEALPTAETGYRFDGDQPGERTDPVHNLESFARLREEAKAAFNRAGLRVLARRRPPYLWHETGTTVIGEDPATSVADPHGQVHGVSGLYVADASALPTAGAVNTALTIAALALRAADHAAGQRLATRPRAAVAE